MSRVSAYAASSRAATAAIGADALRFVALPATRDRNLRGVYMRVTRSGE